MNQTFSIKQWQTCAASALPRRRAHRVVLPLTYCLIFMNTQRIRDHRRLNHLRVDISRYLCRLRRARMPKCFPKRKKPMPVLVGHERLVMPMETETERHE